MPTPKQRPAAKSASKPVKSSVAAPAPAKSKSAAKTVASTKVAPKPASKPAAKPVAKTAPKPVAKAQPKPAPKPAAVKKQAPAPKPAAKIVPAKKATPAPKVVPVAKSAPAKAAPAPKPAVAPKAPTAKSAPAPKAAPAAKPAPTPKAVSPTKAPTVAAKAAPASKPAAAPKAAAPGPKTAPAPKAEPAPKPVVAAMEPKPVVAAMEPKPAAVAKKLVAVETKASSQVGVKPAATTAKPVVEKRLLPPKMAVPAVTSKVMKMTKANEAANNLANLKCPFTKDELGQWRSLLISRRAEISSDIDALEKDAMEAEDGHTTPLHAAERGSDADLQDVSLGLAGEEKDLLWQIDRALRKIDLSSPIPFGICEYTKEAIPRLRLQLIPWTPLSIEGATYMEENGLTIEDVILDD